MNKLQLGRLLLKLLSILPKKYPIVGKKEIAQPFFIMNSGRCGSTLLNLLLNQHSQVFLPPEQYFLHNLIIKFKLYNWVLWRDLGKILAGELISSLETSQWEFDEKEIFKAIVLAQDDERSLNRIVDHIFREYAKSYGQDPLRWGDCSPLNAKYCKEIYSTFPKAKYIYLVRDARDVVASFTQKGEFVPWAPFNDPVAAAKNWTDVFNQQKRLGIKTHVLEVRYENLVTDPQATIARIFDFIEVSREKIDTNNISVPDLKAFNFHYHSNLKKPINDDSIGKWKNALSEREIRQIMPFIERPMKALGYL